MGIREKLNESPAITTAATAGIIIVALGFIVWQLLPSSRGAGGGSKAFFSDDDGAHWYADDARKIPPYDHNGKEADRAWVCKNGSTGETKVVYLERYTPAAKQMQQDLMDRMSKMTSGAAAPNEPPPSMQQQQAIEQGHQLKVPGSGKWLSPSDGLPYQKVRDISADWLPFFPSD